MPEPRPSRPEPASERVRLELDILASELADDAAPAPDGAGDEPAPPEPPPPPRGEPTTG